MMQHGGRSANGAYDQIEILADRIPHPQLALEPYWDRLEERRNAARGVGQIGFEDALELHPGLVVKRDDGKVLSADTRLFQAELYRLGRIVRIVFFPRKTFFLRGGDNFTVF